MPVIAPVSSYTAFLEPKTTLEDTTYLSENPRVNSEQKNDLNASSTKAELMTFALLEAKDHGVSFHEMRVTIDCESGWNPKASNPGDSDGGSWGIVQINIGKGAHPDITKEQAFDPEFALDFMAQEFAKGNQWKWSCWKQNFI